MKIIHLKPHFQNKKLTFTVEKVEDQSFSQIKDVSDKLLELDLERFAIQQSMKIDGDGLSKKFKFN